MNWYFIALLISLCIIIALIIVLVIVNKTKTQCLPGWTYDEKTKQCKVICPDNFTFDDNIRSCRTICPDNNPNYNYITKQCEYCKLNQYTTSIDPHNCIDECPINYPLICGNKCYNNKDNICIGPDNNKKLISRDIFTSNMLLSNIGRIQDYYSFPYKDSLMVDQILYYRDGLTAGNNYLIMDKNGLYFYNISNNNINKILINENIQYTDINNELGLLAFQKDYNICHYAIQGTSPIFCTFTNNFVFAYKFQINKNYDGVKDTILLSLLTDDNDVLYTLSYNLSDKKLISKHNADDVQICHKVNNFYKYISYYLNNGNYDLVTYNNTIPRRQGLISANKQYIFYVGDMDSNQKYCSVETVDIGLYDSINKQYYHFDNIVAGNDAHFTFNQNLISSVGMTRIFTFVNNKSLNNNNVYYNFLLTYLNELNKDNNGIYLKLTNSGTLDVISLTNPDKPFITINIKENYYQYLRLSSDLLNELKNIESTIDFNSKFYIR